MLRRPEKNRSRVIFTGLGSNFAHLIQLVESTFGKS